ncbi:WD repeat-containing protein 86 [Chamberlinius hualienensis]
MGSSGSKVKETGTGDVNSDNNAKKTNKKRNVMLLEELDDHDDAINCMQLSDDGSLLVTGGEDNVARMWSTKTPHCECLGALEGHTDYITCIAIIDTFVLTGGADKTVRKWDMTSCECIFVFEGHENRISRVICTGLFVFTTSYDKTARMWIFDAENLGKANADKACLKVYQGHTKGVYPLVYIPSIGIQSEVDSSKNIMRINPDDLLITGAADCTVRSWSVESGNCLKVFEGHTMPVMCLAVDSSGTILLTAGGDSVIRSWEIKTGIPLKEFVGHNSAVIHLLVVNRMMYSCSCDQTVRAWVIEFGDCTRVYKGHEHSVTAVKYTDALIITGCGDGIVRAFDAKSGALKTELKSHPGSISAMAIVDGRLYTSCVDGKLRVWDISQLMGENESGKAMAFDKQNDHIEKNTKNLKDLEDKLEKYVKDPNDLHIPTANVTQLAKDKASVIDNVPNIIPGVIA